MSLIITNNILNILVDKHNKELNKIINNIDENIDINLLGCHSMIKCMWKENKNNDR